MKNKTLAIFGIAAEILSVFAYMEDLKGNYIAPRVLILVSAVTTIVFTVMATNRLWKTRKIISIIFLVSSAVTLVYTIPLVNGIYGLMLIYVIVQLFKKQDVLNSETKNTTDIIEAPILNQGSSKERVKDFLSGAVGIIIIIVLGFGWLLNVYKLVHLDFRQPFKAEFVRIIGLSPLGTIIGYMNITDK